MTGNWRDDQPSTPERIKNNARSTVKLVGSGKAAVVAIAAVAVILVVALLWSTLSLSSGTEPQTEPKDAEQSSDPGSPEDGTYQITQGGVGQCLRLSDSDDGYDRFVLARGDCDGDRSRFTLKNLGDDTVRFGFVDDGFKEFCLQVDGPDPDDEGFKISDIFYFAPYDCDEDEAAQEFTLLAGDNDTYRIQTMAEQCLDIYTDHEFADGKVVATAECSESKTQPLQLHASQ